MAEHDGLEFLGDMSFLACRQTLSCDISRATGQQFPVGLVRTKLHRRLEAEYRLDGIQGSTHEGKRPTAPRAVLDERSIRGANNEIDGMALVVVGITDRAMKFASPHVQTEPATRRIEHRFFNDCFADVVGALVNPIADALKESVLVEGDHISS